MASKLWVSKLGLTKMFIIKPGSGYFRKLASFPFCPNFYLADFDGLKMAPRYIIHQHHLQRIYNHSRYTLYKVLQHFFLHFFIIFLLFFYNFFQTFFGQHLT